jgi:hypothetical protein
MTTFDPDDYELRWPPQLFVDEANRLVGGHRSPDEIIVGLAGRAGVNEIKWLLTEVFTSTVPAEAFEQATGSGWDDRPSRHMWLAELVRQAASWPEPGPRRPYWSTRTTGRARPAHMDFQEVVRAFAQLIEDFERDGYLVHAFGQGCVDDHSGPGPSPSDVLSRRLGYSVEWPPGSVALDPDDLFDLIEVFHDLGSLHQHLAAGRVLRLPAIVSSVLLPEPLGPMTATSSPPSTDRSTSRSACTSVGPWP